MILILWLPLLQNECQYMEKLTSTHFSSLKTLFSSFLVERFSFFFIHLVHDGLNVGVKFFQGHLFWWCQGGAQSGWGPGWGVAWRLLFLSTIPAAKMPWFPTVEAQFLLHVLGPFFCSQYIHVHCVQVFLLEVPPLSWFFLCLFRLLSVRCSPEYSLHFSEVVVEMHCPFVPFFEVLGRCWQIKKFPLKGNV